MTQTLDLKVNNLCVSYKSRKGQVQALNKLNLQFPKPGLYGLLGPNGSGKSTFFKTLVGHVTADQGSISVGAWNIPKDLSALKKNLGVTFQSPALDKWLTVEENLATHGALYGENSTSLKTKIDQMLKDFSLTERRHDLIKELSGGLSRRVELAKTLLTNPKILILDEPTTGLDPKVRHDFWQLLKKVSAGRLIIVATHLMEEAELCDELVIFHRGQAVAQGTPSSLKNQSKGAFVELEFENTELRDGFLQTQKAIQNMDWKILHQQTVGSRLSTKTLDTQMLSTLSSAPGVKRVEWGQATLADVFLDLTGDVL